MGHHLNIAPSLSGTDLGGRAVMVFVGRHLKFNAIDEEKALLYLIHVMDPVANKPFDLVYLNTHCTSKTIFIN